MKEAFHKLIWIDHRSAWIYAYTHEGLTELAVLQAPDAPGHVHHNAGTPGSGHLAVSPGFLRQAADAMADARAILIVGPAQAKNELAQFMARHMPQARARIIGIEPLGRVGPEEIHTYAKRFFARADRMSLN
jgi:stalled ribosome rescue protein Dom34